MPERDGIACWRISASVERLELTRSATASRLSRGNSGIVVLSGSSSSQIRLACRD